MAIGKGSMARAAKTNTKVTAPKSEETKVKQTEEVVVTKATETTAKKPAAKSTAKTAVKQTDTKASVLTPSNQVMEQIVYQKSAQVLDRDAKDNETFGVGDAMPVYFY